LHTGRNKWQVSDEIRGPKGGRRRTSHRADMVIGRMQLIMSRARFRLPSIAA
jgi:hypothetical protein